MCTAIADAKLQGQKSWSNSWVFVNDGLGTDGYCLGHGRPWSARPRVVFQLSFPGCKSSNPTGNGFQRWSRLGINLHQFSSDLRCFFPEFPPCESVESAACFRKIHVVAQRAKPTLTQSYSATRKCDSANRRQAQTSRDRYRSMPPAALPPGTHGLSATCPTVITF